MSKENSRTQRRLDRIKQEIPIARVLADYGYSVRPDGGDREQQFSCDLHGDKQDKKPSARLYPESAAFYCFGCGKTRDAVALVREKDGLSFMDALASLEKRYDLPPLPWEQDDSHSETTPSLKQEILNRLNPQRTFSDDLKVISTLLDQVIQDQFLTMAQATSYWEAVDQIEFKVDKHIISDIRGRAVLQAILERLQKDVKDTLSA